jgi:hypothetical protein
MYHSFLIFDFGSNEEAAQLARHKLDGWKQAFRLDKKLLYKFERDEAAHSAAPPNAEKPEKAPEKPAPRSAKAKGKSAKESPKSKPSVAQAPAEVPPASNGNTKLLVRLYFSGHEKLSYQHWVDRIPTEEPFKQANPQTIRQGDEPFAAIDKKFESLE